MKGPSRDAVEAALKGVTDEVSGRDVFSAGLVQGLTIRNGHVGLTIEVSPERGASAEPLRQACQRAVAAVKGVKAVTAVLTAHTERAGAAAGEAPRPRALTPTQSPPPGESPKAAMSALLREVGAVIAVASGKGGVGKSTLAVNLALGLARGGQRVGLLDADIYGPSVPRLLGLSGMPKTRGKKLLPMEAFGLKAMSIGLLVDESSPMIWRGPMVMGALTQMMTDVEWGALDILVVDMPPGTGDAQLTMAQRVPMAGAVVVSTPQDLALIDARKAITMFQRTHVPVLGLVENMSVFVCPHCGGKSHIFGAGGARSTAERLGIPFLGEVPLVGRIRELSDDGKPVVATDPTSKEAQAFLAIADAVSARLTTSRNKAPRIVVN